jgi:hypothetical protein
MTLNFVPRDVQCHYAGHYYAECGISYYYAECHYAECRNTECHGSLQTLILNFQS